MRIGGDFGAMKRAVRNVSTSLTWMWEAAHVYIEQTVVFVLLIDRGRFSSLWRASCLGVHGDALKADELFGKDSDFSVSAEAPHG